MAGGGNETFLINRHVIGTRPDKSVPKTCPQIERSGVAVPAALRLQAFCFLPPCRTTIDPLLHEEVLYSVSCGNKKPLFAAASSSRKSPLTDSNRRPPPYHQVVDRCRGLATVAKWLV
jgi:hypothetical protein